MALLHSQRRRAICLFCELAGPQSLRRTSLTARSPLLQSGVLEPQYPRGSQWRRSKATDSHATLAANRKQAAPKSHQERRVEVSSVHDPLLSIEEEANAVLASPSKAEEEIVLRLIRKCLVIASDVSKDPGTSPKPQRVDDNTPASALLSLEEDDIQSLPGRVESVESPQLRKESIATVSRIAHKLLVHTPVFIDPELLKEYTTLQTLLRRPDTLPEVFQLYATKPAAITGSDPVQYRTPRPNRLNAAIPAPIANEALNSAIALKDLTSALQIIETTFATPSFRRLKALRLAGVPMAAAALSPFAAYIIADRLSAMQSSMDSYLATNVAFTGILAYLGFTGILGVVAVTTANDKMKRVTWADGTPLRERWLREEERAAADLVVTAWGFKQVSRWGEEEGEDWEILREWIGLRGMILDRAELMEGME
ncbi:MAG: hypothetical protein M1824_004852 [Vezdaea acicularis]|nr:MAG: hypothetical protein M1824_004852 [Vezdaea acicularis]